MKLNHHKSRKSYCEIDEPGFIDLLIKHYPNGKASSHIHSLNPGQSLFFITAVKGYAWTPNKHPHISLIAGGAGITPIYQLIRGILANPEDKTSMTLVFGVNSDEDVLFENEFAKYEKDYPGRFKVVYTVSNPAEGSVYHKGYVSKELLKEHIMGPEEENTKVFVCGPPAMEKSILGKGGILGQLGYTKSQIYKF
jgi:cytochrome-b5 reductase